MTDVLPGTVAASTEAQYHDATWCGCSQPRKRAVLIPRDLLRWSACDRAMLLDTNVDAVNSALQRAPTSPRAPACSLRRHPAAASGDGCRRAGASGGVGRRARTT